LPINCLPSNRIICAAQFCCFFTAQNVQKIKRPAMQFYMHTCMYDNDCETKRLFKLY